MTYTRRSLIRDAALVSTAAAIIPTGCFDDGPPKSFSRGVRVFFSGAWLFCRDPTDKTMMRAVTINPCDTGTQHLSHSFPYGIWNTHDHWDDTNPSLAANDVDPNTGQIEETHHISVTMSTRAPDRPRDVDELFSNVNKNSRFVHLRQTGKMPYSINWSQGGLRVITLPMPTCIIPGAFRTNSHIQGEDVYLEKYGLTTDKGYATTHIFNYEGATSLAFAPANGAPTIKISKGSTGFEADFHIHTIPDSAKHDAAGMFDALFGLIKNLPSGALKFIPAPDGEPVDRGLLVPPSVSKPELDMLTTYIRDAHIGACCSPGGGVS